ncbi:MAG: hypothetical protein HQK49_17930 [Oligoflexia bacterium]|nr:hypothetical protein [Oligoflexia bacterium]
MGHALIVSDNDVVNDIYIVNFNAYVATNVTIKKSHEEAIKLLEQNPSIDIIISLAQINAQPTARLIYVFLKNNKKNIPLMSIGENKAFANDVINISSVYNIKEIIRSVAKLLEITAKDMVVMPVPDYFPIPLKMFLTLLKVECDVFYRHSSSSINHEYIRILEKGTKDIASKVNVYLNQNITTLYIPASERLRFINLASSSLITQLESQVVSTSERVDLAEQGLELITSEIFENKVASEEVIKISKLCVNSVQQVIKESTRFNDLLSNLLKNKTKYVYLHSVLASYVSAEMLKHISWGTDEQSEKISFVLFYHDIFLMQIFDAHPEIQTEDELYFNKSLNDKEKDVLINHARMAAEVICSFKQIPIGSDVIIKQHHGTTTGMGFAAEFKDDISPLSKIMIIAEEFVIDVLKAKNKKDKVKFDKKKSMKRLTDKYTKSSYRKIIESLEFVNV